MEGVRWKPCMPSAKPNACPSSFATTQQPRTMFGKMLPQKFFDHLAAGGLVVIIATPLNRPGKPVTLAFNKTHLYRHKQLPDGSWISDDPVAPIRKGVTIQEIVDTHLKVLMEVASEHEIDMQIDFELATPKTSGLN